MLALRLEAYDATKHYELIASWWKARGDECLPADVLPPTGAVTYHGDRPIAACSVWLTNAAAAHVAFPITAPGLSPIVSFKAVTLAVDGVIDLARAAGAKFIWASAENRGVDRIFVRAGLQRTTPLNSYFLLLEPGMSSDILVGDDFEPQKG